MEALYRSQCGQFVEASRGMSHKTTLNPKPENTKGGWSGKQRAHTTTHVRHMRAEREQTLLGCAWVAASGVASQ